MRILVTGATGNVGSRVLDLLAAGGPDRHEVVGLARRPPLDGPLQAKARWVSCDLSDPACEPVLRELLRTIDVVIHLAWLIQPSHDQQTMWATNVDGSGRLFDAMRWQQSGGGSVPSLVAASSVGAYSAGPKDEPVAEDWPTDGVPTSIYSRHKVQLERLLDSYERQLRGTGVEPRVVRIRPGVVFSARAASSQARYFLGPFLPMTVLRRSLIPAVPVPRSLIAPIVHSADVAAAFVAAALNPAAAGPYNVSADQPLTGELLASALSARLVRVPEQLLRGAADLTWRLRLQPTDPGWVDLALRLPVMSTRRVRDELGWRPHHTAAETLTEWLDAMQRREGGDSPVLRRSKGALDQLRSALPTVRSHGRRPV